jgi:hypothetical protein
MGGRSRWCTTAFGFFFLPLSLNYTPQSPHINDITMLFSNQFNYTLQIVVTYPRDFLSFFTNELNCARLKSKPSMSLVQQN